MTPDELRRMDNDLCIIYEKGIKPIKANKYYYFKYPEGKLVTKYKLDHNDVHVERGVWRKYNPYNPYVEGQEDSGTGTGGAAASLESLDDLFADDPDEIVTPQPAAPKTAASTMAASVPGAIDPIMTPEQKEAEEKRQAELIDIQKELEAKFDELFGSIDSED